VISWHGGVLHSFSSSSVAGDSSLGLKWSLSRLQHQKSVRFVHLLVEVGMIGQEPSNVNHILVDDHASHSASLVAEFGLDKRVHSVANEFTTLLGFKLLEDCNVDLGCIHLHNGKLRLLRHLLLRHLLLHRHHLRSTRLHNLLGNNLRHATSALVSVSTTEVSSSTTLEIASTLHMVALSVHLGSATLSMLHLVSEVRSPELFPLSSALIEQKSQHCFHVLLVTLLLLLLQLLL